MHADYKVSHRHGSHCVTAFGFCGGRVDVVGEMMSLAVLIKFYTAGRVSHRYGSPCVTAGGVFGGLMDVVGEVMRSLQCLAVLLMRLEGFSASKMIGSAAYLKQYTLMAGLRTETEFAQYQ